MFIKAKTHTIKFCRNKLEQNIHIVKRLLIYRHSSIQTSNNNVIQLHDKNSFTPVLDI